MRVILYWTSAWLCAKHYLTTLFNLRILIYKYRGRDSERLGNFPSVTQKRSGSESWSVWVQNHPSKQQCFPGVESLCLKDFISLQIQHHSLSHCLGWVGSRNGVHTPVLGKMYVRDSECFPGVPHLKRDIDEYMLMVWEPARIQLQREWTFGCRLEGMLRTHSWLTISSMGLMGWPHRYCEHVSFHFFQSLSIRMLWEKEVSTYHNSGLHAEQEEGMKAQAEATLGVGGDDCLGL